MTHTCERRRSYVRYGEAQKPQEAGRRKLAGDEGLLGVRQGRVSGRSGLRAEQAADGRCGRAHHTMPLLHRNSYPGSPEGRSNRRATRRNGRCCCRHSRRRCDYTRYTFVWLIMLAAAGTGWMDCPRRKLAWAERPARCAGTVAPAVQKVTMPPAAVVL